MLRRHFTYIQIMLSMAKLTLALPPRSELVNIGLHSLCSHQNKLELTQLVFDTLMNIRVRTWTQNALYLLMDRTLRWLRRNLQLTELLLRNRQIRKLFVKAVV